jgi:hypothetical protein
MLAVPGVHYEIIPSEFREIVDNQEHLKGHESQLTMLKRLKLIDQSIKCDDLQWDDKAVLDMLQKRRLQLYFQGQEPIQFEKLMGPFLDEVTRANGSTFCRVLKSFNELKQGTERSVANAHSVRRVEREEV